MNKLDANARAQILHLLCEGQSIRAVTRITGASKNTVAKLLVDAGKACAEYQDKGINPMIERHTRWITVFRKTNGTEERLGRHRCETPMDVRTALTLSAAHVFDFPQENGPVLKGDFVETIVAQGDADGSMFGVVGIRPCRDGEWDIGEHEGCGKDTERAVRRYA